MEVSQYLNMFIEESKDNLQRLNENLLKLENNPDDIQILNEIFRVAHTLKGMAGTMGFVRMQKLTHNIENVLSDIRSGSIKINSDMVDTLFMCLDALENYVEEIVNTSSEGTDDHNDLIENLAEIIKSKGEVTHTETPVVDQETKEEKTAGNLIELPDTQKLVKNNAIEMGMNVFQIKVDLSPNCVLKSARAFVIFTDLERFGEIIHCIPSTQDIEDEKFENDFTVVVVTKEIKEKLEQVIMSVSEVEGVTIEAFAKDHDAKIEEVALKKEEQAEAHPTASVTPANSETNNSSNNKQVSNKTVRVNIDRLDTLMNLVSELIIVKTQLEGLNVTSQDANTNYNDSVEYLERVTTNLHDAVMKVRMVPVEIVFNRFPRMIRDISRKLGKDIDLVMSGEETELDRTVIDEIGDPLIHLLRNAADHGLETIEERATIGKPRKGTIKLQAYQDGNSVVIEVEDDGKGINVQAIKNKAVQKGTITKEEADAMNEQEALDLLFRPSFSTAEKISDLSGRGVGLDVVKSKITELGGHVEVQTELGKGSKFIVRLPLTLAIIQALMISIGDEKYAIPLSNIQNIEDVRKEDIKLVQNQEVIMVRNEIIPIVRLHSVLGLPEQEDKDLMMGVIVKKGERQVGFIIDSLIGQQEIVIKSLGKYLSGIDIIAGATILGNGEVALILDINSLI
ncbi:chemotaxis protein CheA [Cellulosilyticum ruminicola]|uniref:chemotaxis protein CheA n=1 Tax=Cellulosilyticum ruminicola TaxID=425254 RepID=UPI0006D0FB2D|nr:chemotaxis protein CheA [Cellulosilyticum ruminicola]